jgi:glutaconate CoA-transferase subunit B
VLITNKAVLRFDKSSGEAYLESYHPGSSVDDAVENTPWNLTVSDDVRETEPPTGEELRVIREVLDPNRVISVYESRGYV